MCMFAVASVRAQSTVVVLDENDVSGANYREASSGSFTAPDSLRLVGDSKLPVTYEHAFSGSSSGVLEYRHASGSWRLEVWPSDGASRDLSGFDSLIVYVNGPDSISGDELPRISLQDDGGGRTDPVWLSTLRNVEVDDESTGFTEESQTNAVLLVEYIDALPASERRPGYPEDLTITFADQAVDTSVAGIGAPVTPARFMVSTENRVRLPFRFRDLDGDQTLSRTDEYIDVLMPEKEGSTRLVSTWRFSLAPTQGSEPLVVPGEGDVFQLRLSFDEFLLDGDPRSWQRLSIPFDEIVSGGDFTRSEFEAVVFEHGGPTDGVRTVRFDLLMLVKNDDTAFLDFVQERTFWYFWEEANPSNGLIKDRSTPTSPASIAAVGFGLSALTVGIDRGWITREQGRDRVARTLRFFWNAEQSTSPDATGYKGFFYHFLDMQTGRRAWNSELSTVDTALLLGGVLDVGEYFDGSDAVEEEIRALADSIYQRVDFRWSQFRHRQNPTAAISHGWKPETGFLTHDWTGYNEAMILYILALGSPTHPATDGAWDAWVSGYGNQWRTEYGYTFLTFPPLFGHQYSHVWIDFRGIQDAYMRSKGIDYFENSRRATLAQREYHIANPKGYPNYGKNEWGLTASDTPTGYRARGAPPPQNDDGTLVPTAPGGSIVFTPEESIAALRTMYDRYGSRLLGPYGFRDAYNVQQNWFDDDYIGIDHGPILLMMENYRTEVIWERMMENEYVLRGLERAGFTGTSLSAADDVPRSGFDLDFYPNPASGLVTVSYSVEDPGPVEVAIYDLLGRRVLLLDGGYKASGSHRVESDLSSLVSGTFFIRLQAADRTVTRSFALIR